MCNAWNHSPGCRCGWGGEGYTGRGHSNSPLPPAFDRALAPKYRSHSGYTNPNATCPVCGAAVFFYQSADGGRVFFDELGPPWPRHPCTDTSGRRSAAYGAFFVLGAEALEETTQESWSSASWKPFIYDDFSEIGQLNRPLVIHGEWDRRPLTLYLLRTRIGRGVLMHARHSGVGRYELSVVSMPSSTSEPIVRSFPAFTSPDASALKKLQRRRAKCKAKATTNQRNSASQAKMKAISNQNDSSPEKGIASKRTSKKHAHDKVAKSYAEHRIVDMTDRQGSHHLVYVTTRKHLG